MRTNTTFPVLIYLRMGMENVQHGRALLWSSWNHHLNLSGAYCSILDREEDVQKRRMSINMERIKTEGRREQIWKIKDKIRAKQGRENSYNGQSYKERGNREPKWDWNGWKREPGISLLLIMDIEKLLYLFFNIAIWEQRNVNL